MFNVLSRVPTNTRRELDNIFPIKTVIEIIIVRPNPAYCNYLISREGKARKPWPERQSVVILIVSHVLCSKIIFKKRLKSLRLRAEMA